MNEISQAQLRQFTRFQNLAFDKSQSRLWPKIENILPFYALTPGGQKTLIPLIQNVQNNRHLHFLHPFQQKTTTVLTPTIPLKPLPRVSTVNLQDQEQKLQNLKTNLSLAEQTVANLKNSLQQKQNELALLKKESFGLLSRLEVLKNEKKAAEAMVKNLTAAVSNLKTQPASFEDLQKLQQRLALKEKEVQEKSELLKKLQSQTGNETALNKEIEGLKGQIATLSQNKSQLQSDLQKEEEQLKSLQKRAAFLQAQNLKQHEILSVQEKALEDLAAEKLKLAAFADELAQKLKSQESEIPPQKKDFVKKVTLPPSPKRLPKLTNLPNAINGIILDEKGTPLKDTVVIIKSQTEQPLRAVRSNELGQFLVSSPMPDGKYYLEIHKEGLKFDILEFELKGEILAPIEVYAHD